MEVKSPTYQPQQYKSLPYDFYSYFFNYSYSEHFCFREEQNNELLAIAVWCL